MSLMDTCIAYKTYDYKDLRISGCLCRLYDYKLPHYVVNPFPIIDKATKKKIFPKTTVYIVAEKVSDRQKRFLNHMNFTWKADDHS